ncbi:hypothetical protein FF1_034035 [Malus domestica]
MKSSTNNIKTEADLRKSSFEKWGDARSHYWKLDHAHKDCRLLKNNVSAADLLLVLRHLHHLSLPHSRLPVNLDDIILLEMSKSRLGARIFLHLLQEFDEYLTRRRLGIRSDSVREMAQGGSDSEEEEDPEAEVEGRGPVVKVTEASKLIPKIKVSRVLDVPDFTLRVVAVLRTLASAIAMGTSNSNLYLALGLFPSWSVTRGRFGDGKTKTVVSSNLSFVDDTPTFSSRQGNASHVLAVFHACEIIF